MCAVYNWSDWDIEQWTRKQKAELVNWILDRRGGSNHVWDLACNEHGTHFLQKVIGAVEPEHQKDLALGFVGKVQLAWSDVSAKYSNYALQKVISDVPASKIFFMLKEMALICKRHEKLLDGGLDQQHPACHKFGCRVLQRMIEHFGSPNKNNGRVFEDLQSNDELTVAAIRQRNEEIEQERILQEIGRWLGLHILKIATHQYAVHVLCKAHEHNLLRPSVVHAALQQATEEELKEIVKTSKGSSFLQQVVIQRFQDIEDEESRKALVIRFNSIFDNKRHFNASFLVKALNKDRLQWQDAAGTTSTPTSTSLSQERRPAGFEVPTFEPQPRHFPEQQQQQRQRRRRRGNRGGGGRGQGGSSSSRDARGGGGSGRGGSSSSYGAAQGLTLLHLPRNLEQVFSDSDLEGSAAWPLP
jgi:uncharacterized membrane protein YgcG